VNVNVSNPDSGLINATASLPAFATLNAPTTSTGTGILATTITIHPTTGTAGSYSASVTATGDGQSATEEFTITVTAAGANTAPVVTAPANQSVNEGQTVTFTVSATDANSDHVTLTASGLPSGAAFNDLGNNTGTFTWSPNFTQSGTYTVTFTGNDGHGGSATATTTITVNDVPTGGATATAEMMGRFNTHRKYTCFRIKPVNNSFDLTNVNLSSITFHFNGQTLTTVAGRTSVALECEGDTTDCESGDCDHDGDEDCENTCDHDGDDDCDHADEDCTPTFIRACFRTQDITALFPNGDINSRIVDAWITGTLATGETFTATFGPSRFADKGDKGGGGKSGLHSKVKPNPLNPKGELSFTLSQPGRVRVGIYNMQGRLVKILLDEYREAGPQMVIWDGSGSRNEKVASGVYYFRIQAKQGEEVQNVTVLK
jgi:PKD repeat protein